MYLQPSRAVARTGPLLQQQPGIVLAVGQVGGEGGVHLADQEAQLLGQGA